jgi:hypothetical protein
LKSISLKINFSDFIINMITNVHRFAKPVRVIRRGASLRNITVGQCLANYGGPIA